MAIMIPSVISPDVKSNAEKHIFKWFQKAPGTEDWIILHSLGVSNHKKVIHGEVDFFALIPEMGIFALEVKGGRVRRQNGIWSFTDKYGHTDTKERGPFDQAWEGIYSLKESISKMLDNKHRGLKDVALLDINRTSVYYKGTPISQEELDCKSIIDRLHTDNPAWGARQLSAQLKKRGHQVGRRKTRRYMNEMGIDPIYPKMNLSKRMQQAKVCPYLLRNAVIDRPNQAWSIDITYIAIKHGFLYLTAVIDWYSRCIVGWEVDDTLDTRMVITALKKAFMVAKPVILNSDQGCQFTSNEYMNFLKENQIFQSMDGKSRWADNIMIERWFRSFKYEEAYLTQYNNIREARKAISNYVHTYNFEHCHSALNNRTPASCYYPILLLDDCAA